MKSRLILTAAGLTTCAVLVGAQTILTVPASPATVPHKVTNVERQVLGTARADYSLPANHAVCWSTGRNLFACQLTGPRGFHAIATGNIVNGQAEAVYS